MFWDLPQKNLFQNLLLNTAGILMLKPKLKIHFVASLEMTINVFLLNHLKKLSKYYNLTKRPSNLVVVPREKRRTESREEIRTTIRGLDPPNSHQN